MNDKPANGTEDTPRPAGHNMPPLPAQISEQENFAQTVTDFLNERFADAKALTKSLLAERVSLGNSIDGPETKGKFTTLIKRIRDHAKAMSAYHEKEGTNYLRGKQAVDQMFFSDIDLLSRRDKKNKAGAADELLEILTAYDTELLRLEQARRDKVAADAARKALEAQQEAKRLADKAEADRLAADRARNPVKIEEKKEVAEQTETAAVSAAALAEVALESAQAARIDTFTKPADIMRSRGTDGTLSTMATEPYAEVVPGEDGKLDMVKLWPFIPLTAKEQALRAWAKTTAYNVQMEGAAIGRRPKSVVR